MFTGIVTDIGKVLSIADHGQAKRIGVQTLYDAKKIVIGESISCAGVCLTVVDKDSHGALWFDVSHETLACTNLRDIKSGDLINLERALAAGDAMGGHMVLGHVDCLGYINTVKEVDDSHEIECELSGDFIKYIAPKGSVCMDGVSLTVNEVEANHFTVNIIPHTWSKTTFCKRKQGDVVNVEIDVIARYLERLMH